MPRGRGQVVRLENYLYEAGVRYSRSRLDSFDMEFRYQATHVPTGKSFADSVFIPSSSMRNLCSQGVRLLDHWNRLKDWRYDALT